MFRLFSLIPASWALITSGTFAGMRGRSVSTTTIHVRELNQRATGGTIQPSVRPAEALRKSPLTKRFGICFILLCSLSLMHVLPMNAQAATLPGTDIDNTATATFNSTTTIASNLVRITTVVQRTPSVITFLQYAPTESSAVTITIPATFYSTTGDLNNPLPDQSVGPYGDAYTLPGTIPVVKAGVYHGRQPLIVKLADMDQNLDPTMAEQVRVRISCAETGSEELLLLTEDGTDSGIFYGYVLTDVTKDTTLNGILAVQTGCTLTANYIDAEDSQDTSTIDALIDPYGIVFDSVSGTRLNGAIVTLWDVTADAPANVFDDFGTPGYPSTVTTGDLALGLPQGGFRFPLIEPGREYRLDIVPPAGYATPSTIAPDELRSRFGSQFAIDDVASYGSPFFVNPGPTIHIDIPTDPAPASLWLQKEANEDLIGIGDFLQYTLTLENVDENSDAASVVLEDRLPLGFRYQKGSLSIDGLKAPDPTLDSSGRLLNITLGDLAASEKIIITYVVEVGAGAQLGEAVNMAQGRDLLGNTSNKATATVIVKEDFFRSKSFLAGRVMIGTCDLPEAEKQGLANVRIYLEDGSYLVTDKDGKYHFEGIDPGVHVVQLDLDTVPTQYEVVPCEETSQFAGRSFSQFIDLQGGTLWRADFNVDLKPKLKGHVEFELQGTLEGDIATFQVPVRIGGVPLDNLSLTVILPKGLEHVVDSSHLGEDAIKPTIFGQSLIYRLGQKPPEWSDTMTLQARVTDAATGELATRAILTFDTPASKKQRTPMAESLLIAEVQESRVPVTKFDVRPNFPTLVATISTEDKAFFNRLAEELKGYRIDRLYAIGHTDDVPIATRSQHVFADNFILSMARANSVARYLGDALNLPPTKIVTTVLADTKPLVENNTDENRSLNRRVEIRIEGEKIDRAVILEMIKAQSGPQSKETVGRRPGEDVVVSAQPRTNEELGLMPDYDAAWLENAAPGLEWLWPSELTVPSIPSIKVAIKHLAGQKLELTLDGEAVSPLAFSGTTKNGAGTLVISSWRGIGIKRGDNHLQLTVRDASGNLIKQIERLVHFGLPPAHAEFVTESSTLFADGRTVPVIAVRLTDEDGYPVGEGVVGEVVISKPYRAHIDSSEVEADLLDQPGSNYQVGPHGIARIRLEPTTTAGEALLRFPFEKNLDEVRAWLKPAMRDWILVGFAEGTLGYNNLSGNQISLEEAGIDEHFYDDGQVKFFAKGAIKGEWLLTMAYDSDKPDLDGDSLHQVIDPNSYYPLYGDGTNQGYEASSARDLYLKIERDQFYALFGDMNTGLNQTDLSRYNRSMNGVKSEMQTDRFSYTLFAADTKQAFAKDEIRGDGTSGRYYLSQQNLVINSEEVVIETRDRFRSEIILDSRPLQRYTDYDIDYDDGSFTFKRPVPSKDKNFDPVFIVVRYETKDSSGENLNYGGRAAVKVLNQKVEVGGTYVHEENGAGKGDLYGVDATAKLTPQTNLHLEAARTENKFFEDDGSDNAYLAELSHDTNRIKTRAYYLEQGEEFGLGQQNSSESGTRKYGAETLYHFTPKFSLAALAYHEDLMVNDNKRNVGELDARYQAERYGLNSGFRYAEDRLDADRTMRSEQLLAGGYWLSANSRLKLRADHEQSLKGMNKNVDYPTRTIMGLDYQVNPWVSVFAEQEFTWGKEEDTEETRVGFNATPWQGGEVRTTVEREMNENSQRVFAIFGLGQSWRINERLSIDAALDRSYTVKSDQDYQFNENVPTAQGSDDDFTSVSIGSTYRKEKWTWWNRLETRQADGEDKYGVSSSIVGEPQDGIAVSAKALAFISDVSGGTRRTDGNIRLGMAYRPTTSRWIVLNRLDFYFDREDNSPTEYDNWRIVNNIHANFRLNRKLQMSFYYGLKYVRDNYDGRTYSGYTDLIAFESRYNISKRWDIGVHGSVLHSWNSNTLEYSAGADVGYSPMTNTWVSLGYNVVGFEDEDFSAASYTAQGAYMRFRAKFDQQSVRDAAEWMNR